MKEKLLQVEQQLAKSEHDLALKGMEAEEIKVEQNKAWIKLNKGSILEHIPFEVTVRFVWLSVNRYVLNIFNEHPTRCIEMRPPT